MVLAKAMHVLCFDLRIMEIYSEYRKEQKKKTKQKLTKKHKHIFLMYGPLRI